MKFKDIDTLNKLYNESVIEEEGYFDPSEHNDKQAKEAALAHLKTAKEVLGEWESVINSWVHMGKDGLDENALEHIEVARRGVEDIVMGRF